MFRMLKNLFGIFLCSALIMPPSLGYAVNQTVYYTQIVKTNYGVSDAIVRVWVKDEKMRMESDAGGEKFVLINREDGVYNYIPSQNMLTKIPRIEQKINYVDEVEDFISYLKKVNAKIVGEEEFNGVNCEVYEYLDTDSDAQVVAWVWKEKKFPMKIDIKNYFGKTSVIFDDVRINEPIPESFFELPQGAIFIDMTQNLPNMGDILQEYQ